MHFIGQIWMTKMVVLDKLYFLDPWSQQSQFGFDVIMTVMTVMTVTTVTTAKTVTTVDTGGRNTT